MQEYQTIIDMHTFLTCIGLVGILGGGVHLLPLLVASLPPYR